MMQFSVLTAENKEDVVLITGLADPQGLIFDPDGNLIVTDLGYHQFAQSHHPLDVLRAMFSEKVVCRSIFRHRKSCYKNQRTSEARRL